MDRSGGIAHDGASRIVVRSGLKVAFRRDVAVVAGSTSDTLIEVVVDHEVAVVQLLVTHVADESVSQKMGDAILKRIPGDSTPVVFDCELLTGRVSSCFLGMLVRVANVAGQREQQLALCSAQNMLAEAIRVTQFDKLLSVFSTREEALYALGCEDKTDCHQGEYRQARTQYLRAVNEGRIKPPQERFSYKLKQRIREFPVGKAVTGSMFVAYTLICLAAVWLLIHAVGVALTPDPWDAVPVFGLAADQQNAGELRGRVECPGKGPVKGPGKGKEPWQPDAHALILAWPADDPPHKVSPQVILDVAAEQVEQASKHQSNTPSQAIESNLSNLGFYLAVASPEGRFRLRVPANRELAVLVISRHLQRDGPISVDDRDRLARCLTDPYGLVNLYEYDLSARRVDLRQPDEAVWRLEPKDRQRPEPSSPDQPAAEKPRKEDRGEQ